MVITSAEEDM